MGSFLQMVPNPHVELFGGIGRQNHGRPWACEREGPVTKKMLWKVGVYSRLSERLIRDGRDSEKRVVLTSIPPKSSGLKLADFSS